jgi:hypothetical protein
VVRDGQRVGRACPRVDRVRAVGPAIDRSAALETVVVSVSELLPGVGSDVAAATVAVLLSVAAVRRGDGHVDVGRVATLSVPRVHVTVPEAWLHVHPEPAALTNETPAGRLSVTVSELAVLGPALATDRVYVIVRAGRHGIGVVGLRDRQVCGRA